MRRRTPLVLLAVAAAGLTAVAGTATGATRVSPTNTYRTYAAPAGLADDAGEPSIGVNHKTGAAFLQAGLTTAKVVFDKAGRATWSDVSPLQTSITSLDPIAASDDINGRIFVSQLTGFDSLAAFSDDDGRTWTSSQGGGLPSGVDHQTIGSGPYPAESSVKALTSFPNAVYYCSQELVTALCARSDTGGLTFGAGVPIYTTASCAGLHGHVRVSPDGTVYVPNKNCGGTQGVAVSRDAGLTWTVSTVPGSTKGKGDPSVAAGKDGTAYLGMTLADGRPAASVSLDKGKTWSTPYDVGRSLHIANAVFADVVAGDGDRAAMSFLGTTTPGDAQSVKFGKDDAGVTYTGGSWHVYVATTYDRGRTWTTVDATPGKDPVQRGKICLGGTAGCEGNTRNLLDFTGIEVDRDGRVLVGWADGCTGACVESTLVAANKGTAHGTITRQVSGKGLFRARSIS